jgi:hypothetical protein
MLLLAYRIKPWQILTSRLVTVLGDPSAQKTQAVVRIYKSFLMDGRVAEWFKAPVLKTGRGFTPPREFESHPFRHFLRPYSALPHTRVVTNYLVLSDKVSRLGDTLC